MSITGLEVPMEAGPRDTASEATACKAQRSGLPRVTLCSTVCDAAQALSAEHTVATLVQRRPLAEDVARAFDEYVASRPRWPGADELHALEATHGRVAIIDFTSVPQDQAQGDALAGATGYGRDLPPRKSANVASARTAIELVLSVLPAELASVVMNDASELLAALRRHTGRRQFILRLELNLGDTCQRWHRDLNISRSIVTYCGPGTLVAHEEGVSRADGGDVIAVDSAHVVQAGVGDVLIMKGGIWDGVEVRDGPLVRPIAGATMAGAAHRAPTIGPVPSCAAHRLMLKVDVSEDF